MSSQGRAHRASGARVKVLFLELGGALGLLCYIPSLDMNMHKFIICFLAGFMWFRFTIKIKDFFLKIKKKERKENNGLRREHIFFLNVTQLMIGTFPTPILRAIQCRGKGN